tara:strand:- start:1195 stop:1995 length:801 start_codon:yes stop_codon:yes gene_type:complete
MSDIGSKKLTNIYGSILQVSNGNTGVNATLRAVKDGVGSESAIGISTDKVLVKPTSAESTTAFQVKSKAGAALLTIDSTNSKVLAGTSQVAVNTQYAYFGINFDDSQSWAANKHYAIPFGMGGFAHANCDMDMTTGTDPTLSWVLANVDVYKAAQFVPFVWYVPDNIVIDEITSIEGASAAASDTTRMHLVSYDYASNNSNVLTNGVVVANTDGDTTNTGNNKTFKNTWSLVAPSISGGKACLCSFRSDSVNSDFSISVIIKYRVS